MRTATLTAAFLICAAFAAPLRAEPQTVTGLLIDRACYQRSAKNTGQRHTRRPLDECATACAKAGLPLAILTADSKVYDIVGELAKDRNQKLIPHLTHTITVTGDVTTGEAGRMRIAAVDLKMAR